MAYATYEDVIIRYPILETWGKGETEVSSDLIFFAENELNSRLASHFSVPFSAGYPTVKDLTIDLSYYKALLTKDPEKAKVLNDAIVGRLDRIKAGDEYIWTGSDYIQPLAAQDEVWSNVGCYHPVFGMHDYASEFSLVDSSRLAAEEAERA